MPVLDETRGRGFHLVSEAKGHRSREAITIDANAGDLVVGTILGELTASPGVFVLLDPGAADGSEVAAAVLYDRVVDDAAEQPAVAHVRDCEVNSNELNFGGADAGEIATATGQLEALGIILRS